MCWVGFGRSPFLVLRERERKNVREDRHKTPLPKEHLATQIFLDFMQSQEEIAIDNCLVGIGLKITKALFLCVRERMRKRECKVTSESNQIA